MNRTLVLVRRAFSSNEWADHPSAAAIAVNQAFIDRAERIVELLKQEKLNEARERAYPLDWLGHTGGETFRSQMDRMAVTDCGNLYYCAEEKHSDVPVECAWTDLAWLKQAYEDAIKDGRLVLTTEKRDHEEAIEHLPCRKVEYDVTYFGGDYAGVGSMVYLPVALIEAHTPYNVSDDDGVRRAFQAATGIDPVHIVSYTTDELFTFEGQPFDDGAVEVEDEDEVNAVTA
jgi:hypothetical protein